MALYDDLGGAPFLEAALDHFYDKVLADDRINGYFKGIEMSDLKRKGRAFLTMAFGGPNQYQGNGLRMAHAGPRNQGLDANDFEAFMGHFRSTLEDFGVDRDQISEVMAIAYSGKDDVLGR